jgi:hypothetical protein
MIEEPVTLSWYILASMLLRINTILQRVLDYPSESLPGHYHTQSLTSEIAGLKTLRSLVLQLKSVCHHL